MAHGSHKRTKHGQKADVRRPFHRGGPNCGSAKKSSRTRKGKRRN